MDTRIPHPDQDAISGQRVERVFRRKQIVVCGGLLATRAFYSKKISNPPFGEIRMFGGL